MRLFRQRRTAAARWIFANEVLSAVTHPECERLAELARGAEVLEIGAYYGRSTIALASVAAVVHSVDPHQGGPEESSDTLPSFLTNLTAHSVRDRVLIHVGPSTGIVPLFKPESFDMAFVDAMHQRPEVDIDLALAARCLRPGGWLVLHDYGTDGVRVGDEWHPFGVTEAVDEFVSLTRGDTPEIVESLAILRVPTEVPHLRAWLNGLNRFGRVAV